MIHYNRYVDYPLNLIEQLGGFPYDVDMKLVEENFDNILLDYFSQEKCFLTAREKTVILERYKSKKTLEEIGKHFNITRERVRQIEVKAIRKLKYRKEIFSNSFNEYLKLQKEYVQKRQELCDKIIVLDELINKAVALIHNDDTTIREIKEFLELESEEKQNILARNADISDLDLTVRSYHCLKRAGINTIQQLSELTISDLMKVRNLGRKSVKEITEKLKELGIELEEE